MLYSITHLCGSDRSSGWADQAAIIVICAFDGHLLHMHVGCCALPLQKMQMSVGRLVAKFRVEGLGPYLLMHLVMCV